MMNEKETMNAIATIDNTPRGYVPNFGIERVPSDYADDVINLLFASMSDSTRRTYTMQFRNFAAFAMSQNAQALPAAAETVAAYIARLVAANKSVSTVTQALAAIRAAHMLNNLTDPTAAPIVKRASAGARRTLGVAPKHQKAAATDKIVRELVAALDRSTIQGKRDAAIILLGFFGAFRRSELVALDVADLEKTIAKDGRAAYLVTVRKSKTDQEGAGMVKGIFAARSRELDPVAALDDYMKAAGITDGAIFRRATKGGLRVLDDRLTPQSVALVIKDAAKKANIAADLAGHSLRSGFITSALAGGASERSIMNQSGHKSVTVMRGYQRRENALSDNAASGLAAGL